MILLVYKNLLYRDVAYFMTLHVRRRPFTENYENYIHNKNQTLLYIVSAFQITKVSHSIKN